jgi:hypothetical protein
MGLPATCNGDMPEKKEKKKKDTKPTSSFALMSLAESRKGIEDGREERGSMQTLG